MGFFNSQTVLLSLLRFGWDCRLLRKCCHSPMNKLYHFQQLPLHTPKCYSSFESIRIDFLISTVLSRLACRNIFQSEFSTKKFRLEERIWRVIAQKEERISTILIRYSRKTANITFRLKMDKVFKRNMNKA